ncbi:MAG: hypothetical protein RIQ64_1709 [Actinomycetota bacterium]|jgi:acyl-CoA reductase-like NAD-dependent aldehyde dehydrogenase
MGSLRSDENRKRLAVNKTHKLFIAGAFPRSESGRSYEVFDSHHGFLANMAKASRKDARDAAVAARNAQRGWANATAYNRGQILYRMAELMEGRRSQFISEIRQCEGLNNHDAEVVVSASIDRLVWYAGWSDKLAQVIGNANAVAGPYFNFSLPEPTGVVATVAPESSSLLGLISVIAPTIVASNTIIVIASETRPVPAIALAEVIATSDVPAGVVNVLTGSPAEIMPWLASHADVNGIDLSGVADAQLAKELETEAAGTIKRIRRPSPDHDWFSDPGLGAIRSFLEIKTVWHPQGT